jgi:hypothetical protein
MEERWYVHRRLYRYVMICMYVDEVQHRGSGWVGVQHI